MNSPARFCIVAARFEHRRAHRVRGLAAAADNRPHHRTCSLHRLGVLGQRLLRQLAVVDEDDVGDPEPHGRLERCDTRVRRQAPLRPVVGPLGMGPDPEPIRRPVCSYRLVPRTQHDLVDGDVRRLGDPRRRRRGRRRPGRAAQVVGERTRALSRGKSSCRRAPGSTKVTLMPRRRELAPQRVSEPTTPTCSRGTSAGPRSLSSGDRRHEDDVSGPLLGHRGEHRSDRVGHSRARSFRAPLATPRGPPRPASPDRTYRRSPRRNQSARAPRGIVGPRVPPPRDANVGLDREGAVRW